MNIKWFYYSIKCLKKSLVVISLLQCICGYVVFSIQFIFALMLWLSVWHVKFIGEVYYVVQFDNFIFTYMIIIYGIKIRQTCI